MEKKEKREKKKKKGISKEDFIRREVCVALSRIQTGDKDEKTLFLTPATVRRVSIEHLRACAMYSGNWGT